MEQRLLSKTVEVSHTSKKKRKQKVEIGKDMNRQVTEQEIELANKNMKKFSNSNRNMCKSH